VIENGTARLGAGANGTNGRRLIGWKAIGQFLGCTERTARRWEADRALPVHRIPGGGRSSVWANSEELAAWLRALASDVQTTLRAEASCGIEPAQPPAATPPAVPTASVTGEAVRQPRPSTRLVAALSLMTVTIMGALLWNPPIAARTSD